MADSNTPETPYEYESEQPPSLAIVHALAELEGVDPTNLGYTLYDYIHPESLDILGQSADVELMFLVEQYTVHITECGTIRITQ